ncbi:cold-shock protein [Thiopseudomonas denitrificans]|uniref:CspA family cold shock protein n=1 Tax=Thiopseudomonas denitrificans TaxID=1501432 RepID=A0A4R6U3N8_9GAMM|nr:CspA family cold shock protein [Thiopseudomonas denitrificans]
MSKSLCFVTSSLLVAATAAQATSLFVDLPVLPVIGLALTAAGTLFYLLSGRPGPTPQAAGRSTDYPAEPIAAGAYHDAERETGTVKWFNTTKGFGFISRDNGDDIFVHFRAIRGEGHRVLSEGQRVEYNVVAREKGLQAEDVIDISA